MWSDDISFRIGIQPRTPFIALFRMPNCWRAWTAVRDMQAQYSKWQGTFIDLFDDGSATRITIYEDGSEDVIRIKEAS